MTCLDVYLKEMVFAPDDDMEYLGMKFNHHISRVLSKKRRNKARKKLLVERKGGACEVCGNVFPDCVFDFHHQIAAEKITEISKMIAKASDDEFNDDAIPEAMKCSLLCSNCHRLVHFDTE